MGTLKCINPIPFEWVPIWHPLSFSLYLRHGFHYESEDVEGNRVKTIEQDYVATLVIELFYWITSIIGIPDRSLLRQQTEF